MEGITPSGIVSRMRENIKEYQRRTRELAEGQIIQDTKTNIWIEFGEYQQKRISEIFTSAVDRFYASYDPFYYQRAHSLYDLLDIHGKNVYGILEDEDITEDNLFDKSVVTPFERGGGAEGLYELVFKHGYHGGAKGTDANEEKRSRMSYRTPYPHFKHWGRYAKKAKKSPYDEIMSGIEDADDDIYAEFKRIADKHTNIMTQRILEEQKKIVAELF